MSRHGHTVGGKFSPTYHSWVAMKTRCTNSNHVHADRYIERGIGMDPEWMSFEKFLADMGERPVGTTLERCENDKGYSVGNCRWATKSEQMLNRGKFNVRVVYDGREMALNEACDLAGIKVKAVHWRRWKRGMSHQGAFDATVKNERV